MSETPSPTENRLGRRKARTRAALIRAAQTLIAQGRTNVPILEITQAADVDMGSFYNHFETKEQLFDAAFEAVLDAYGEQLARARRDITAAVDVGRFERFRRLTHRQHQRRSPVRGWWCSCSGTRPGTGAGRDPLATFAAAADSPDRRPHRILIVGSRPRPHDRSVHSWTTLTTWW